MWKNFCRDEFLYRPISPHCIHEHNCLRVGRCQLSPQSREVSRFKSSTRCFCMFSFLNRVLKFRRSRAKLLSYLAQVVYRLVVEPRANHIKRSHSQDHHHTADHAGAQGHHPAIFRKHLTGDRKEPLCLTPVSSVGGHVTDVTSSFRDHHLCTWF